GHLDVRRYDANLAEARHDLRQCGDTGAVNAIVVGDQDPHGCLASHHNHVYPHLYDVTVCRGVPMRVMLVHNPGAGGNKQPDRKTLLAMVRAAGPWGCARCVEACGLGVLPSGIRQAKAAAASAPPGAAEYAVSNAVGAMRSALYHCTSVPVRAMLDGRDISGRYLLLEAMNMSFVGPNLNLAARADPGDG